MTTTTAPPLEHSAWLRGRIAERVNAATAAGLDPHNGPGMIVWPLGTTGKPGTRADRECDRCGTYQRPGAVLVPVVLTAAPRMVLAGGLCVACVKREAVPA